MKKEAMTELEGSTKKEGRSFSRVTVANEAGGEGMDSEKLVEGTPYSRRRFLVNGAASMAVFSALTGQITFAKDPHAKDKAAAHKEEEDEATPLEDLMHEHGVLNRLLLVFDEIDRRLVSGHDYSAAPLIAAATIMRDYMEAHHESIEEEFIFPHLAKDKLYSEIVATLLDQHKAGNDLTKSFLSKAAAGNSLSDGEKSILAKDLKAYVRMFRSHEAWEDTVIYPAFRRALGRRKYREFGEEIERVEHERFGEEGFDEIVAKVASIEKELGIYNLAQFTARLSTAHNGTK